MSRTAWMAALAALLLTAAGVARAQGSGDLPPELRKAVEAVKAGKTPRDRRDAARALGRVYPPPPQAVAALLDALGDADVEVVREAARSLGRLGADSARTVPALARAAERRQAPVTDIVLSLRLFGPEAAPGVPLLARLVREKDRPARLAAMLALQSVGPAAKDAVPALQELLQEKATSGDEAGQALLRAHAAFTLWTINRDASGVPAVVRDLAGTNPPIASLDRRQILELLGRMGPDAGDAAKELAQAVAISVALERKEVRPEKVPFHLRPLVGPSVDRLVMPTLAELGPAARPATSALADWLATAREREVWTGRWFLALRALAAVGPMAKTALPVIEPLLEAPEADVRLDAALAVYCITGNRYALARLTDALRGDDAALQRHALECLARSGARSAAPAVRALLDSDYADVRGSALLTWAKLDPTAEVAERAGQVLRRRATPEETLAATQALALVGPAARPFGPDLRRVIVETDNDRLRDAALEALIRSGAGAAPVRDDAPTKDPRLAPLAARLRKPGGNEIDPDVLSQLAALRPMPADSLPLWLELLDRHDPVLTRTAVNAIGRIGEPAAPAAPALVQAARADTGAAVTEEVVVALVSIGPGPRESVPFLAGATHHYDARVRSWAVSGLMVLGRGSPEAAEALKRLVKQDQLDLQVKAALALATVAPDENGVVALAARLAPLDDQETTLRSQRDAAAALLRLARQGDHEAAAVLVRFVRLLARRTEAARGGADGPPELRHVLDPSRQAALVLAGLGDVPTAARELKPLLLVLARDPGWPLALLPLVRNAEEGDRAALEELVGADPAVAGRDALALAALYRLTHDEGRLAGLARRCASQDAAVRTAALLAVLELGSDAAALAPRLRELLADLPASSQVAARAALWLISRDEEALRSLMEKRDESGWDEEIYAALCELVRRNSETAPPLRRVALDSPAAGRRLAVLEALSEAAPPR